MLVGYDEKGVAELMGLDMERSAAALPHGFQEDSERPTGVLASSDSDGVDNVVRLKEGIISSSLSIEMAVEQGLPRAVLRRVAERIAGGDKSNVSALGMGCGSKTTLERRTNRLSHRRVSGLRGWRGCSFMARRALGSEDEARVL